MAGQDRLDLVDRQGFDSGIGSRLGGGAQQRVVDRLNGGINGRFKKGIHLAVADLQPGCRLRLRTRRSAAEGGMSREGNDIIARSVGGEAAGAGNAEQGAGGQALQIAVGDRCIGGNHDDNRAVRSLIGVGMNPAAPECAAHRHPGDSQILPAPEIGLYQHSNMPWLVRN